MFELENKHVKRGVWTNWSQGSVMGRTLTVEARVGIVVIALLTLCASIGMAQLFHLLTFMYHQLRAKGKPSDGLFWQQQALLRTLPTPTALVADYAKLWWSWRHKTNKVIWRCWTTIVLITCFAAAAIAVGISVSYIVQTSNLEVLVSTPFCRFVNQSSNYIPNDILNFQEKQHGEARTYTRQCYQNTTDTTMACRNTFVQPRIPFTVQWAACPWDQSMCLDGQQPAIAMDSEQIDLKKYFGWNLKQRDSLWFRRRTVCNVLPLDGHYDIIKPAPGKHMRYTPVPDEEVVALRYGTYPDDPPESSPDILLGYSFVTSNRTYQYTSWADQSRSRPSRTNPLRKWVPLKEMNRTDADVLMNIIFLNNVGYLNPIDDPVFSAHRSRETLTAPSYKPDFIAGIIGCTDQVFTVQFCAAQPQGDKACTSLGGIPPHFEGVLDQIGDLTEIQREILIAFIKDQVSGGEIFQLPKDQWIKELMYWQGLGWAGLTIMLSDIVIGPELRDSRARNYTHAPVNEGQKALCQSLKMRKTGGFAYIDHRNINVFGLAFVVTFSMTIAVVNFFILRFFVFLESFRKRLNPRVDRWINDGVHQLQRRAFEGHEDVVWVDLEKEVPVTRENGVLITELPLAARPVVEKPPAPVDDSSNDQTKKEPVAITNEVPQSAQPQPDSNEVSEHRILLSFSNEPLQIGIDSQSSASADTAVHEVDQGTLEGIDQAWKMPLMNDALRTRSYDNR
ncbi:hypothetical protein B0J11DRAFT_430867 [Dendryphion nanum]|uniref:Uncharacterized protein n=1 Tax=Dendryphion nanum TaxID=256645 RepID=A0A9P9E019_9PLEO|nr:hypothetical protein B0J11DRAFT_430867 [Dendryphion nanum]